MPTLLTQQAAAARLGISVRTLQKVLADPTGPPTVALGSRRFLPAADLDAWLEGRCEAARQHRAAMADPDQGEAA